MKIQSIVLLMALGFVSACGSSGGKKDSPKPVEVTETITATELALTGPGSFDALEVGKAIKVVVKGKNDKGETVERKADSWDVKPATLALINGDGVLLPQAAGTGELVAKVGNQQLKVSIQVLEPDVAPLDLKDLLVEAESNTLTVGEKTALTVKAQYSDSADFVPMKDLVKFTVTPANIGNVVLLGNGAYQFDALNDGEASIVVNLGEVRSKALKLTVQKPAPAVTVKQVIASPGPTELLPGDATDVKVEAVYSDESKKPVTEGVDFELNPNDGTVKVENVNGVYRVVARKAGTVNVTAGIGGVKALGFTITVKQPAATITDLLVASAASELFVGSKTTLTINAKYSDNSEKPLPAGEAPTVKVEPAANLSVKPLTDGTYEVTGEKEGEATLVVTYAGIPSKPLSFKVNPKPASSLVILTPTTDAPTQKLNVYDELKLAAFWKSEARTEAAQNVTWKVKTAAGIVSQDGVVRATQAGKLVVEASTQDGSVAALEISVEEGPDFSKMRFWIYGDVPDTTKFFWNGNPGGKDFIYTAEAEQVSSAALNCGRQSQAAFRKFLNDNADIVKEIQDLKATTELRVILNVVKNRESLAALAKMDRSPYFWHWNVLPGQVPVLSMSLFDKGVWVWEVNTTRDGAVCEQPDAKEGRRYLEHARQRLKVKADYIAPTTTPR